MYDPSGHSSTGASRSLMPFRFLQQGLDTGTSAGKATFGMRGVFAEFEREMCGAGQGGSEARPA